MNRPPLIAVDIGNSSTKLGLFDQPASGPSLPAVSRSCSFKTGQPPGADCCSFIPQEPCRWHIASVHRAGTDLLVSWLQRHRSADDVRLLNHHDLPIATRVEKPDRVGLGRLVAAVAANVLRTERSPAIVVDAGSAITVDLIAADGAFEGGVILPGFRMSAEALDSADQLPLVNFSPTDPPPAVIGKDTQSAIRSGLFWGAVGAVREIIDRMTRELPMQPDVFVTGGDLRQLTEHLGEGASFVPNMVLSGIAVAAAQR